MKSLFYLHRYLVFDPLNVIPYSNLKTKTFHTQAALEEAEAALEQEENKVLRAQLELGNCCFKIGLLLRKVQSHKHIFCLIVFSELCVRSLFIVNEKNILLEIEPWVDN